MIYERKEHWQFLEEELRAQTEAYKVKLDTSALFLLQDREELFVAQFLKFLDGEMILKFSRRFRSIIFEKSFISKKYLFTLETIN